MKTIKENKEIIIQLLVFSAMGWYLHKTWLFYVVGFLLLLLPFPAARRKYIQLLNGILTILGTVIKTILFALLFVLVIIPVGLILQRKSKTTSGYISRELSSVFEFKKLW